jgi:SOS response regulatory protein OraA/RecX
MALRAELRLKGMADAVIDETLQTIDEHSLARQAAERKLRSLQNLDWQTFRTKLSAHLARRGFSYEIAAEVCRAAWQSTHIGNEVVTDGE